MRTIICKHLDISMQNSLLNYLWAFALFCQTDVFQRGRRFLQIFLMQKVAIDKKLTPDNCYQGWARVQRRAECCVVSDKCICHQQHSCDMSPPHWYRPAKSHGTALNSSRPQLFVISTGPTYESHIFTAIVQCTSIVKHHVQSYNSNPLNV